MINKKVRGKGDAEKATKLETEKYVTNADNSEKA